MSERLLRLATRIRDELAELDRVAERVAEGWGRALRNADDYYLDGVALNLHGFYSGLERIFELIAATIDGVKPKGENWHQALLQQMTTEAPALRPAVISQRTFRHLDDYRGFRHVVRNSYSDLLREGDVMNNLGRLELALRLFEKDFGGFVAYMRGEKPARGKTRG